MTEPRPKSDRGQGRKPLQPGVDSVVITARVTPEQAEKWRQLGAGRWLRERIDRAKLSSSGEGIA